MKTSFNNQPDDIGRMSEEQLRRELQKVLCEIESIKRKAPKPAEYPYYGDGGSTPDAEKERLNGWEHMGS